MKKKTIHRKIPSLNPRRLDFCKQYLIDFNGTQAAVRSGFSPHTADVQACRLLGNVKVRAEIDRLRKQRENRLEASADFVVRELMRLAKFDISQAFDDDGSLKDIKKMPEDITRCLASVEISDLYEPKEDGHGKEQVGYTKKIRAWDKIRALEALGEHFGIFKRFGSNDPKEEEKTKRLDLLQVIKILSQDGKTATIIESRIGQDPGKTVGVAQSGARGYRIL